MAVVVHIGTTLNVVEDATIMTRAPEIGARLGGRKDGCSQAILHQITILVNKVARQRLAASNLQGI